VPHSGQMGVFHAEKRRILKLRTRWRSGVNSNFRATLLAVSKPSKPVRHLSAPGLGRVREAVSLSVLFTPDVSRSECAEASWALTIPLQGGRLFSAVCRGGHRRRLQGATIFRASARLPQFARQRPSERENRSFRRAFFWNRPPRLVVPTAIPQHLGPPEIRVTHRGQVRCPCVHGQGAPPGTSPRHALLLLSSAAQAAR
jgi:hypothetical protein